MEEPWGHCAKWNKPGTKDKNFMILFIWETYKRTRNSLRISEVEASAKCNRAGNGETCQLGQHLGRGMWSGPLAKRGRNAAGLPNRELEACAGSHQPATGHAGKGARRRGTLYFSFLAALHSMQNLSSLLCSCSVVFNPLWSYGL